MRPRTRDSSFLYMAALAGAGGLLAIVASIGVPIWMSFHGRHYEPAFSLFTGWGVAALGGAYGCLHTYWLTDSLRPPGPHGGMPISVLITGNANVASAEETSAQRAA